MIQRARHGGKCSASRISLKSLRPRCLASFPRARTFCARQMLDHRLLCTTPPARRPAPTSTHALGSFLLRANEVIDQVPMSACGHQTDMPKYLGDVRCWVNSGKHLLALSFSGFDPG